MLHVLRSYQDSSRTTCVVFAPSTTEGLSPRHAGAHIKLFFPRGDQRIPVLPKLGPKGPIWPPPHLKPVVRTYSIRHYCPQTGELTVEFVLHDHGGPASQWAAAVQPGQRIGLAGPGPVLPVLSVRERPILMVGDLSARPAITAILRALPQSSCGQVHLEIPDPDQQIPLQKPPGMRVFWHLTGKTQPNPVFEHREQILAMSEPNGQTRPYAWLAGEHASVVTLRDQLRTAWDLGKHDLYAFPYWKRTQNEEQYHEERHRVMDEVGA